MSHESTLAQTLHELTGLLQQPVVVLVIVWLILHM
jgi:hypothetical protein